MVCRLEHAVPDFILAVHLINQISRIAADLEIDDIRIDLTGALICKRLINSLNLLFVLRAVFRCEESAADDRYIRYIKLILFAEDADAVDHRRGADNKCKHDDKIIEFRFQFGELAHRISCEIMTAHEFITGKDTGSLNPVGAHGCKDSDSAVAHAVEIDRACLRFQAVPDGYFFCNKLKHSVQVPS